MDFKKYLEDLIIRIPVLIMYIIVTIMEILCVFGIFGEIESICISAHEISNASALNIMFVSCPLVPNICYIIGIFLLPRLCRDPMCIVYNFSMGIMCIIAFVILMASMTKCGNEAQSRIKLYGIFGLIAGIFHLLNGVYTHCILPWDETYLKKRSQ